MIAEIDKRLIANEREINSLIEKNPNFAILWGLIHERTGIVMTKNGIKSGKN